MGVTQMYIGSPKQILPGAFSLATVNPLSCNFSVWTWGVDWFNTEVQVGTGSKFSDVNLQVISCLVPAINDRVGRYSVGGTDNLTLNYGTLRTVYSGLNVSGAQFIFVANFLSYAPGNIRQRIGMANDASTLNNRFFYITNPSAGNLRLEMQSLGGVLKFSPTFAVATGTHKHEIRFNSTTVEWYVDNNLIWSGDNITYDFPHDQGVAPFFDCLHVAGAGSGTYDLNIAFIGWGLLFG